MGLVLVCLPSGSTDVAASPSQYMIQPSGIPILSPVLFMHVGDPYIPSFKIRRIFDLLVSPPFLVLFRQVATRVYMYNYYPIPAFLPLLHPCPHCSSTVRFVTKKNNMASFVRVHTIIATY